MAPFPLFRSHAAPLLLLGVLCACGNVEMIETCVDAGSIRVVCGLQNPEDLAEAGDGRSVIVSQFGGLGGVDVPPGSLALFDATSGDVRPLYPSADVSAPNGASDAETGGSESDWGDPGCTRPPGPAFSPHGIDLATLGDGRKRLLVVNHGGRESVEVFRVFEGDAGVGLEWKGCVPGPAGALFNDVVNLPDGGFLVTDMLDADAQLVAIVRSTLGFDTGQVYEWQPATGLVPVPGTAGPLPNGIELSPDAREIYLNLYGAGEVRRISRETGELLAWAAVPAPDNLSWARDGRLLVASHRGGLADQQACMQRSAGACPMAFAILALDPKTLAAETVFANQGPPLGAGTVALDRGDELLIGTFAGDRMIRVPRP